MKSKFLQMCEEYLSKLESEESEESCRSTIRTDVLRNKVKVPYGGTYKVGRNGKGVGIPRGSTSKQDAVGQMHVIPPGHELKIGPDGKGTVVCPGKPNPNKKPANRKLPLPAM